MATSPLDSSKINLYGAEPADTEEYQKALQSSVDALSQRYANPNWFNVAAGFLKPQLGGFSASLGSASQAMGENLEKQRESQLPLAQMRAQLAASKIAMGQKSTAAREFSDWQATGKPMSEAIYSRLVGLAPGSATAEAAKAAYEGERANQGILSQQQTLRQAQSGQALQLAQQQFQSGAISREEYQNQLANIKSSYAPTQPVTSARPIGASGTTDTVEGAPSILAAPLMATGTPVDSSAPESYAKQSDLRKLADVKNIPFDAEKEIADTKAQLSSLSAEDRVNAIGYIKDLEARIAGHPTLTQGSSFTKPKAEKIVISSPFATNEQGLDPEALKAQVAVNESVAKTKYDALEKAAGPTSYQPAKIVIEDQMSLIRNNPELAKQVTAILSKGDFASQVATMLEKGVGVSLGGISGQIHLPVAAIKQAGWTDKQRDLAQTMANNYAKMAVYQQRLNNVNPNAASNAEAGLYNGMSPTMETTPNASLRAMGHFLTDLDATNAQYKFVNDVYHNRNPDISVGKNVPDRYSAIMSHPSFAAVYDPFGKEHAQINAAFQRHLAKKP